jgi:hypothetical protein
MAKYGRGLNREIVGAVNNGVISEPFGIPEIRQFTTSRGWDVPETYVNVTLANASSEEHSITYKKYFYATGNGAYRLRPDYRGPEWK